MTKLQWFDRSFQFGLPAGMLPFYLERLWGTIARLEKKVSHLSESILSEKLEGKWSIKQNIAHLAEIDLISGKRIEEMRNGIQELSPAVIQTGGDYNKKSIQEVMEFFASNRKENIIKFESLDASILVKTSVHPRLKLKMSPVDLAWFDAEHDDHHLVRINEIASALKK